MAGIDRICSCSAQMFTCKKCQYLNRAKLCNLHGTTIPDEILLWARDHVRAAAKILAWSKKRPAPDSTEMPPLKKASCKQEDPKEKKIITWTHQSPTMDSTKIPSVKKSATDSTGMSPPCKQEDKKDLAERSEAASMVINLDNTWLSKSKAPPTGHVSDIARVVPELSCKFCNKSFQRKSGLVTHMTTCGRKKIFACNHCKKSFTRLGGLKKHIAKNLCRMITGEGKANQTGIPL